MTQKETLSSLIHGNFAKELSISEDNVRKRFERAKLLLKTIMKGCGGYEESRAV